ncbi:hypothetical protein [Longimicrobium terrae]|uniref:Uncharacterized protein n=1 Tax=Longimicrobium terrae TaxID=1639882 RepID=A0A841GYA6_9BACT|nr:hypothetical protein [Longimicrobium terrae]MBB4636322.1 hypothetical protein [Longimicrobium terrae]MBB6070718.1 hypothetical protein [Longimicrobium terrae]NNC29698.1 hypothetical protein [Longimicrobium terrae]
MSDPEEFEIVRFHPRPSETVELSVPLDALAMLRRVAEVRDVSLHGLLQLYVGQALREDYDAFFPGEAVPSVLRSAQAKTLGSGAGD